jgi:6-carboxyhexanoate--CoA ligase
MKSLWSIRMRASKEVKSEKLRVKSVNSKLKTQNSKLTEVHISGAEGLYGSSEIQRVVKKYIERGFDHPKGRADKIVITIEEIKQKPKQIPALPVATVNCLSQDEGRKTATKLLQKSGISREAIDIAFALIRRSHMRGAAIISAGKGSRLEPDRERGVRVSRLGIEMSASRLLSSRLSRQRINTDTVKEALILASKVISCKDIIAELCISDDPDYTTGYVASKKFGYVRIPNIKDKGSRIGGRAFFVKEEPDMREIIHYLEKVPVIIREIDVCRGFITADEIINNPHK